MKSAGAIPQHYNVLSANNIFEGVRLMEESNQTHHKS